MKRFLVALTLICVLSVSAMGGDIPTVGASSPAPTQSSAAVTAILTIISIVAK